MKKTFLSALAFLALLQFVHAQVLFNSSFGNLTLQTYTATGSPVTQYTDVPSSFSTIDDGFKNDPGSVANPNSPYQIPADSIKGWAVVYNAADNDTFLVSTSWLDSTTFTADRWVITPFIPNIPANTVLTWRAKSPDPSYPDGYEVYGTATPGVLNSQSFSIGDRLFVIADGNTAGAGEKSTWTNHAINLSNFAGQTLRFAFRNNSKNMYQLWIDDIRAVTLPSSNDGVLQEIVADKYVLINSSNVIKVNVANNGASDITTMNLGYSINNSQPDYEDLFPASALSYGQSGQLSFGLPYSLSSPGLYTIKAWIHSVNAANDQDHSSDTVFYNVTVLPSAPSKTTMIEQFVSANNGESPDAQARTFAMQIAPAIVVNVHDEDSLKEAGAAPLIADYKEAYATALFDRTYFSGNSVALTRPNYGNWMNVEIFRLSPVGISIINSSYNQNTRQLSFTVKADFLGEVKGDYRINAYLTENQVCGPYSDTTINGYNQLNNYYNVPWSQYYEQGYYASSANTYVMNALLYKHQNTLVHTFDGVYGLPGLIPSTGGTQGQSYQKTYTLTLPTPPNNVHKFNPDNIYIVGFVAEYNSDKTKRTVLNAAQKKLNSNPEFVGIAETSPDAVLSVYPNPSNSGLFYLQAMQNTAYDLQVYDLFGKCLKSGTVSGSCTLDLSSFANGIYLITLRSGDKIMSKKLVIQKN